MKRTVTIALVTVLAAGCANSDANIQRETARNIGGLSRDQVVLSDVKRGATEVRWVANTPKGQFRCFAHDMLRRANCVK